MYDHAFCKEGCTQGTRAGDLKTLATMFTLIEIAFHQVKSVAYKLLKINAATEWLINNYQ